MTTNRDMQSAMQASLAAQPDPARDARNARIRAAERAVLDAAERANDFADKGLLSGAMRQLDLVCEAVRALREARKP